MPYASQFWNQRSDIIRKLNTAIATPLRRALGLRRSTHTLSILVECDVLTADRYAKLYAVNYVGRAIRNPHSNPTTKAVAANYTLATADEKQNTTHSFRNQPYRYDRVLSPQAMTSNAVYEHPMNGAAKRMYQNEQLAALRNDKWGSSLKLALPTDFSMRTQHHIKTEALQPS